MKEKSGRENKLTVNLRDRNVNFKVWSSNWRCLEIAFPPKRHIDMQENYLKTEWFINRKKNLFWYRLTLVNEMTFDECSVVDLSYRPELELETRRGITIKCQRHVELSWQSFFSLNVTKAWKFCKSSKLKSMFIRWTSSPSFY